MQSRCGAVLGFTILVFCVLASGCTLRNPPPVDIYSIDPEWGQSDPARPERKGVLVVQMAPVRGSRSFTGTDIFYTDTRHVQHSYAYSRWKDAPVKLMQTVFAVTIENSGLFKAVLSSVSESEADFLLESTLLECGHVLGEDGASAGIVRMHFNFIDNKSRKVVASKELVSRITVSTLDARGATAAINRAAIQVANDLVGWLGTIVK